MANFIKILKYQKYFKLNTRSFSTIHCNRVCNSRTLFHNPVNQLSVCRFQTTDTAAKDADYHSIIKDTEKPCGEAKKHEFQAETKMLLDIVARSLYSEKEVFVRELISNASDALEKFRYINLSAPEGLQETGRSLEIHISTNKQSQTLTIQDTGIGMTYDEIISNLGVIARSGSKAFLEEMKNNNSDNANIIGQFGVGFYSVFMVADSVEVFTKSSKSADSIGYRWSSTGTGEFEIQEADGVQYGTKIIIHLKSDCREFADDQTITKVIAKYSNFVGSPLYLNGTKINTLQPLWLMDPKSISTEQHIEFYKFISGNYDRPRFILQYNGDVPLSIHALIYFPESKPALFELARESEAGIALYSRKVLIQNKTSNLLPKWLRFVKGVVDSEDIPLNLSRELLQNSNLLRRLREVLTSRVVKFLVEQMNKNPEEYEKFYADYGLFIKEGIITNADQAEKEEAAKLLLFESSHMEKGKRVTIADYMTRDKNTQVIYYLSAPNRILAECSPYYEGLKKREQEVLFCYEPYDELVLMQLQQYKGFKIISVEKDMREDKAASDLSNLGDDSLKRSEVNDLTAWLKKNLSGRAADVTATTRLENHPCVVTVDEMAAARHFIRTQGSQLSEDRRYALLQPKLEINPKHPIIKKLHRLVSENPELATLLGNQLFINSMVGAGLVEDPRELLTSMTDLLTKAFEKH